MTFTGYSDRINHALAYAAKHHDQQVRKGTRLPYFTQPANVAVILTRYSCSEDAVVAGILHDVVQGAIREGWDVATLEDRIGSKFGNHVLQLAVSVVERRIDDDGVELSLEDKRQDRLDRFELAQADSLWVAAATELHNANTLLSDLKRTAFPETVWARVSAGRTGTVEQLNKIVARFREIGFTAPIVAELQAVGGELQSTAS